MTKDELARLPELLFQIGKVFGADTTLSQTLTTVAELVAKLSGAEACSIMLADPERKRLLGRAAFGLVRDDVSEINFRYGEGIAGWVAENLQSTVVDDVTQDPRFASLENSKTHIRSLASVPLNTRDKMVGVLTITSPQANHFRSSTVDLLQLVASIIALDIENIRLRRVSVTDKLTGAFNRDFLDAQLPACLENAKENRTSFSLVMIDVDHFKNVNDTYGHDTGDRVLTTIASRIRDMSRNKDMLIRFGGEEFLLLLPHANLERASDIANRIRQRLQTSSIEIGSKTLHICVSAGVATYHSSESAAELLRRADKALYQAKTKGRNRVEIALSVETNE